VTQTLMQQRGLAAFSIVGAILVSAACGGSPTQAVLTSPTPTQAVAASPTPDAVTQKYVALIKTYWIQVQAADQATDSTNVAALVCLGKVSRSASNSLQFIDPAKCRERMLASLQVHQKFLSALKTTAAPPQFSADDRAFRSQLPKGIAHLKALISITATRNKAAVLQAAMTYVNDFFPIVTSALDDVDPSVVYN
jgi:hypothetical protein